jgi:hypothetical protein
MAPVPRQLALFALLFIGGCSIPRPNVDPVQSANVVEDAGQSRVDVVGDWDDVSAALAVGLGKLNLAVVDGTFDQNQLSYTLVDVLDRPAQIRVTKLDPAPGVPEGTIRISAFFTRYRDKERERLLVAAVAQRLAELRGVDIAPVR